MRAAATTWNAGPGGIKCACCRKGTARDAKRGANRCARRRARQEMHDMKFADTVRDLLAEIPTRDDSMTVEIKDVADHVGEMIERARHVAGGAPMVNRLRDAWSQLLLAFEKSEELDADAAREDAVEASYSIEDQPRNGAL